MAKPISLRTLLSLVLLTTSTAFSQAEDAPRLSYQDLLAHLTDLDRLPAIEPGTYCRQFSSYDRSSQYDAATDRYIAWDANGDSGNYIYIDSDTQEGVMAEMSGPGCIFRIWSANPQGLLRLYLDGDTQPTFEWDFHQLCTGNIKPFIRPLVWKRDPANPNSASNIYLPIPFAKSCKVTSVIRQDDGQLRTPGHYYIIDYRVFPKNWKVDSFKLPLSSDQWETVQVTANKWANCGTIGAHPLDRFATSRGEIMPGQTKTVAQLKGPAVIRQFRAKLRPVEKWAHRKVLLKIYWDDQETPAVNCPIGDFFGEPKDVPYLSYPMGITEDSNYSFFPMPFHTSAKIVLSNEGDQPAPAETTIVYRPETIPDNWGLFHAKFRAEIASTSFDYPLIKARGTGKLVGICLFPDNIHGGWWGEGDEKVYVDGEKFPSWFGTGSEDYFGDAWGIRCFHNPSHGFPQEKVERLQGCYRWHLGDNIPFYQSLVMTIENYTGQTTNRGPRNDYSSVAYWYQLPGGSDFFSETPLQDRIPRGFVAQGAIEAERHIRLDQLGKGMSIVDSDHLAYPLSSSRGVRLTGKVGDTFTVYVPAEVDDFHNIRIIPAKGAKASDYECLMQDKRMPNHPYLKRGLNPLAIRFTGKPVDGDRCELIVDYYLVDVHYNLISNWLVIGPFPNVDHAGFDTPYPPETEIKPEARYEGRDDQLVGWQRLNRADGIMTLNGLFNPPENLVAYGTCIVEAPAAGQRTLLIGSDDGAKIWLNGEPVWSKLVRRGIKPDEDQVEVKLRKGRNTLLIKVEQGIGDVGWAIRFRDPGDELIYRLPD